MTERVLCDTNILVRVTNSKHRDHSDVMGEVNRLHEQRRKLVLVPQVCYEYYVVATRPKTSRGLGLSPVVADSNIDDLLNLFRLLPDEQPIFTTWRELIKHFAVRGKQAHDARLVAAMRNHEIETILTCNAKDFQRYNDIHVVEPVLAA